ncbi:Asd/ArgC dimerization domain-containing protein [Acidicapsa ligni]|uniref:Asd/ArgC dimerization domain-containing protein n=1 Tax=Acidicapsa ligni TaxID=542300 RepID=UPI0021E0A484|nr:Asd/ArgC dimerization domain-containing protein [Acidicapsa ligni]
MATEYKIALVGASSLLAKELKEALTESPLASASFLLLDEKDAQGQLDQIGDEVIVVQSVETNSFEGIDFTFFAGSEEQTKGYWRHAVRAGSMVLDLSGALDGEPGVLVRSPWLGDSIDSPDLLTKAIVPANAAALALALLLDRLQEIAEVKFVAATVLQPASEFGKDALDELHQQTVSLLSFQTMPRAMFDTQVAYNMLSSFGESATANLANAESRIRRHYAALAGNKLPELRLQLLNAPVFHGHTFSICIELDRALPLSSIEDALGGEHLDLVLEATDSPSNLAAVGQNDVLVWLKPEPPIAADAERGSGEISRFWLWAASDNLRLTALNAIDCALDLRRLRPKGQVQ